MNCFNPSIFYLSNSSPSSYSQSIVNRPGLSWMERISISTYLMLNVDETSIRSKRIESIVESEPRLNSKEIVSVFKIKVLKIIR